VLGATAAGATADAAGLVPHRALYSMELVASSDGAEVSDVRGNMAADWTETCEGWSQEFALYFDVVYEGDGPRIQVRSTAATWESRDGKAFVFTVRNETTGQPPEVIEGRASVAADGKSGTAVFSSPREATLKLPAGTIFPTEHTQRVLEAIPKAPTILTHQVFDGFTLDGPIEINSVLGKAHPEGKPTPKDLPALKGHRSWPLQMAFFMSGDNSLSPDREQAMRLYDNGVGDELVLDFGDFRVKAELVRLEMRDAPRCDD
jgi:hypothetical protein